MNDQEISDKVASNVHLVRNIVMLNMKRQTSWRAFGYDELYSVGLEALWVAVKKFDANRGCKFQTFAEFKIVNGIKTYIRESTMSRSKYKEQFDKVYKAQPLYFTVGDAGTKVEFEDVGDLERYIEQKRSQERSEAAIERLNEAIRLLTPTERMIVQRLLSGESKTAVLGSVGSDIFSSVGQELFNSTFLKLIRNLGGDPANLKRVRDLSLYDPEGDIRRSKHVDKEPNSANQESA